MKKKSEVLRFEPLQWRLKVWNLTFWVRFEEGKWYVLTIGSSDWDNYNYINVKDYFKTIGDVELYILKTFRIDTSFSS